MRIVPRKLPANAGHRVAPVHCASASNVMDGMGVSRSRSGGGSPLRKEPTPVPAQLRFKAYWFLVTVWNTTHRRFV